MQLAKSKEVFISFASECCSVEWRSSFPFVQMRYYAKFALLGWQQSLPKAWGTFALVTVWCTVSHLCVIGPYFFQENTSAPSVWPVGGVVSAGWCHSGYFKLSMEVLTQIFPRGLICTPGDIQWPVHSPDLAACHFFLWGYFDLKLQLFL